MVIQKLKHLKWLRSNQRILQNSDSDMEVLLAVFDQKSFEISTKLLDEVESYIDQNYVDQSEKEDIRYRSFPGMMSPSFVESTAKPDVFR